MRIGRVIVYRLVYLSFYMYIVEVVCIMFNFKGIGRISFWVGRMVCNNVGFFIVVLGYGGKFNVGFIVFFRIDL